MKKIIIIIGLIVVAVAIAIIVAKPKEELVITGDMIRFMDKGIGFVSQIKSNAITIQEKDGSVTYAIVPETKIINSFSKSIKSSQSGQAVVLSLNPSDKKVIAVSLVEKIVDKMVDSNYVAFGTVVSGGTGTLTIAGLDGKEKTFVLNDGVSLASQSTYDLENIVQGQKVTIVSHADEQGKLVADVISVSE